MIWKESYRIGVDEVDEQHKELFTRLNSFLKLVLGEGDKETKVQQIAETLDFMGEYVVVHFDAEEALQQRINYPGYEEHKGIHEKFKAEIRDFKEKFTNEAYNEDFVMAFSGRLLTWLINHVAEEDQKIGRYVGQ